MVFLALLVPLYAGDSFIQVRNSVFSDRQLFWPELRGKGRDQLRAVEGAAPVRIGVMPVRMREYKESLPCDSCHRLSANGMEFFLENYLKDKLQHRFPPYSIELIAPHSPFLRSEPDLLSSLDSLDLPLDRWFADSGQEVIYRPRDRFTRAVDRKRLDGLGGVLGKTHLLLPLNLRMAVTPQASNTHQGGLEWEFALVLWNVAEGVPEWALLFREKTGSMNLDESLAGRLDKALGRAWDRMPGELTALWKAEPR